MNIAGQSAPRPAHGLSLVPCDAGGMLMHADNRRIDHLHGCVMRRGQRVHDACPDATRRQRTKRLLQVVYGQNSPAGRAMARPSVGPKSAIKYAPVIYTRNAARLIRQERLDGGPFKIGEFVAHGSRLWFGSLNHAPGDAINLPGPLCQMQMTCFTSAFGGTADMAAPAAGLAPVENDPKADVGALKRDCLKTRTRPRRRGRRSARGR